MISEVDIRDWDGTPYEKVEEDIELHYLDPFTFVGIGGLVALFIGMDADLNAIIEFQGDQFLFSPVTKVDKLKVIE